MSTECCHRDTLMDVKMTLCSFCQKKKKRVNKLVLRWEYLLDSQKTDVSLTCVKFQKPQDDKLDTKTQQNSKCQADPCLNTSVRRKHLLFFSPPSLPPSIPLPVCHIPLSPFSPCMDPVLPRTLTHSPVLGMLVPAVLSDEKHDSVS